ncbi:hypothetical protein IM40_10675 (plasmid) [Candidatus Paracaedimonas acanthamoebae]|nr:hypothetical protein IM40_10240 [Candidatus Paracaedimonas acanthamoebae]AIL13831.1 hypothetical protein IM40_10675 [Candidatus Paracaedimonas acanthamoebae]
MNKLFLLAVLSLFAINDGSASEQKYENLEDLQKSGYPKLESIAQGSKPNKLEIQETEYTKEELRKERKSNLKIAEKRLGLKKKTNKVRRK